MRHAPDRGGDGIEASFVLELTILALAIFLGIEVISKVPTMLHTPLMSGTNAIHGIVIVGRDPGHRHRRRHLQQGRRLHRSRARGSANVVGGFVVTDRMLQMFRRREPKRESNDD